MSLGFCLLGTGESAEYHARALQLDPKAKPLAVAGRSRTEASSFAYRHGIGKAFDDPWYLLPERDVDVAVIATPTCLHRDHLLPFVESGRSVIVESPLASSQAEAEEVLARAEDEGVYLGECNPLLFVPALRSLKSVLDLGLMGDEPVIEIGFSEPYAASWLKGDQSTGLMMNQGYRPLELLLWLLPDLELESMEGNGRDSLVLHFTGGSTLSVSSGIARKTLVAEARGNGGRIRIENDQAVLWEADCPRPGNGSGFLSPYAYLDAYYNSFIESLSHGLEVEPSSDLIRKVFSVIEKTN